MTPQQIFDKYAKELLVDGLPTLRAKANIAVVIYTYDSWRRDHKDTRAFIYAALGIPYWILTDPRIHLLIEIQYLSWNAPDTWRESLKEVAKEFSLEWKYNGNGGKQHGNV